MEFIALKQADGKFILIRSDFFKLVVETSERTCDVLLTTGETFGVQHSFKEIPHLLGLE